MNATIVAVSSKGDPGLPKHRRAEIVLVADHGVEGDYHAGKLIRHRGRARANPLQPNLRQVHIIHSELFDELAACGIAVAPGQMGENITTRGLAVMQLSTGTLLRMGESAVIEITGMRNPCKQLDAIDKRLLPEVARKADDGSIIRRGGIMGVVVEGGVVRPGDDIRVEAPVDATPLAPI